MSYLTNLILTFSAKIGYSGIILLMTIESSFIPFPSEIIIPPAAYLAQLGEMNIYLVILAGVAGSLIGACINYYLAMTLGRKIIYSLANTKLAHVLLIDNEKITLAENYFLKYGNLSTLICRLIPAVRQLISIPAGFSKMKLKNFLFFTALGSAIWTTILAILGYTLGANQEILSEYYHEIKLLGITIGVVFISFFAIKIYKSLKQLKQIEANTDESKPDSIPPTC